MVTKIADEGKTVNGVTTYDVTIEIENVADLKIGMNVDINLLLDSKKDVIRVSMDAISKEEGKFYVYVKDENVSDEQRRAFVSKLYQAPEGMNKVEGYKKQFIETGLSNKDYIEVISGLKENDKVYQLNTTKSMTDFMMTMGR